ncbi:hypothetical protein V8G54_008799, partial [Vigna mungo]
NSEATVSAVDSLQPATATTLRLHPHLRRRQPSLTGTQAGHSFTSSRARPFKYVRQRSPSMETLPERAIPPPLPALASSAIRTLTPPKPPCVTTTETPISPDHHRKSR